MRKFFCLIIMVALVIGRSAYKTEPAEAAGLSYADHQPFSLGFIDLEKAGPLAAVEYPCARSVARLAFETSHRSLYGLKELTDNRVGFMFSAGRLQLGAAAATFGEPDYFHQEGLSLLGNGRYRSVVMGASIVYQRLAFTDRYDDQSLVFGNLGVSFVRATILAYGVVRAVNRPAYYTGGPRLSAEVEFGLSRKWPEHLISQGRILLIESRKPSAQLAQEVRLNEMFALNWTLVLRPVRLGGGLTASRGRLSVTYSMSHHPILGFTHLVSLRIS